MTDEVWRRDEVDSPCVRVCLMHPDAKICAGCYRTADEIANWSRMSNDERRALKAKLPGRAGQINRRRGGRRARVP